MKINEQNIPAFLKNNYEVSANLPKGFEWKGVQYIVESLDAETAAKLAAEKYFPYWKVKEGKKADK